MVAPLAGGLLGLGLALPTGLAFGFGYGYGVRQGYHSFSPSKSPATRNLYQQPDPIKGALGQGLLSAEERTKAPLGISEPPSIGAQKSKVDSVLTGQGGYHLPPTRERLYSKSGKHMITRAQKNRMSRAEYRRWYNETSYIPRHSR